MEASATWQDTATAIGTLVAVFVSLGIAVAEIVRNDRLRRQVERGERRSVAGLVTAWVEDRYVRDESGLLLHSCGNGIRGE